MVGAIFAPPEWLPPGHGCLLLHRRKVVETEGFLGFLVFRGWAGCVEPEGGFR